MQLIQKLMNTLAVAQPLIPAMRKPLQPLLSQVAIQKGNSQTDSTTFMMRREIVSQ